MSKTWYNIKALDNGDAEVYVFDEIGSWGVLASMFIAAWPKAAKNVTVKINSPGGDVTEGLAIFNFLQEMKQSQAIACRVEGIAASMASVIAMAGTTCEMSENSLMMIHNPWGITAGDSGEMRKTAEILDKMRSQLVGIYAAKTGKSAADIEKMMDDETWMTAKEAIEMKFADRIVNAMNATLAALVEPFRAKLNEGRLVAAMAKAEPPKQEPPPVVPPAKASAADILAMLQKAMASEWVAFYQYWLGSIVARGCQRVPVAEELAAHAEEEYGHAETLAARIVELGGLPQPGPGEWDAMSPCKYDAPINQDTVAIVTQNHAAEKCAIAFYQQLLAMTAGVDEVTYDIVLKILEVENEHESDLRKFLEDAEVWAKAKAAIPPKVDPKDKEIADLKNQLEQQKVLSSEELLKANASVAEMKAKLDKAFPSIAPKSSASGVPAKPQAVSNYL